MYLIKNGTIHVGDGRILKGYDLLTQGGKISRVARDIKSDGAKAIDAGGCEVFPGFIDPNCAIGAQGFPTRYPDNNETTEPVTPEMNVKYSIDPDELNAQEFYKSGITAIGAAPGNGNIMGGQIAVCKTAPQKMEDRLVKEKAALKISVTSSVKAVHGAQNRLPKTKMGIFYLLEESIRAARAEAPEKRTKRQKLICRVFDEGSMPVFAAAASKGEIDGILQIMKDEKTSLTIVDGFGFGDCMERMKRQKTGLILGNLSYLSQISKYDIKLERILELVENGNPVAFTSTCEGSSEGREAFLWTAIEVYKAGVPAEEVVKMMTLNPAKMLNLETRLGTIEEGKDADISIFTAHPVISYGARLKYSIVNGEVAYSWTES